MTAKTNTDVILFSSTRFGSLEVSLASVINFTSGIIGFPDLHRYVILDAEAPFSWLQSLDSPELAFVVINSAEFGENYQVASPFGDPELELGQNDEIALMNIVTIPDPPSLTTVNLKAPLVVNIRTMKAKQIVLDNPHYSIHLRLWDVDALGLSGNI